MISLVTDAGPDWASFIPELALAILAALGWAFSYWQKRQTAAAEAKAAKHAHIASGAQQALSRLEEEKARREEKERRAKPWEVTFRAVDTYELTNLTGEAAYDVRGVFFGQSMEHFPQGVDMDYRASKTFVWATTFDEDGCEEITLIWKDSPDGENQQFTLVMPTKY